jgi:hypothetical protein
MFRGNISLHLQGRIVSQAKNKAEVFERLSNSFSLSASAGLLLGTLFYSEDGSDMFLRNVGLSTKYTDLQFIRS